MTPQSSCKYNGHGFNDDGVCIYCHEDDGTQEKASDDQMTQPNQSKLEQELDELLQSPSYGVTLFAGHRDVLVSHIVRYITANYIDINDYVALEAEMELLKYKLRKAEESAVERAKLKEVK